VASQLAACSLTSMPLKWALTMGVLVVAPRRQEVEEPVPGRPLSEDSLAKGRYWRVARKAGV